MTQGLEGWEEGTVRKSLVNHRTEAGAGGQTHPWGGSPILPHHCDFQESGFLLQGLAVPEDHPTAALEAQLVPNGSWKLSGGSLVASETGLHMSGRAEQMAMEPPPCGWSLERGRPPPQITVSGVWGQEGHR